MVLPDRIELSTSPLPRECSTTELRQRPKAGSLGGAGYAIAPEPVQPLPPAETGVPRQLAAGRRVCLRFSHAGRRKKDGLASDFGRFAHHRAAQLLRRPYRPGLAGSGAACRLQGRHGRHLRRRGHEDAGPMGLIAAAGVDPKDIRIGGARFDDLHRGGWDPTERLADQDKDGVAAEIIYPTVGMLICNHPDLDYKKACFDAYNRWLQTTVSHDPDRLIGIGQTACARSRKASRTSSASRRWASGRHDAGQSRREGLRRSRVTIRSGRRRSRSSCRSASTS